MIKVLHVVPSLNVETGGPARSVSMLADAQTMAGMSVTVLTLDYQRHGRVLRPEKAALELLEANALARFTRGWSPAFARRARELAASHDLIHNHGLWMQVNRFARMAAEAFNRPLISSPRGMLEPYSRQRSVWRKRLAHAAFEARNLAATRLFHATAELEAAAIRAFVPAAEIAILPNIVANVAKAQTDPIAPPTMLFLGRLDQKKGLDWLLHAWQQLRGQRRDWQLHIAGPCGLGFESEYHELRRATAEDASVHWLGPLDGDAKAAALADAAVIVLPSRSENFGNVVTEALWTGRPVLTTHATPWAVLAQEGIGWVVDATQAGISAGVATVLASELDQRLQMGARAHVYAKREFSREAIAAQWQQTYQYVLGAHARPACVWQPT
ncbi:hypothetical protein C7S18_23035 [Ahniella affigens]|uniref:Glycosyltransferase subfamily 4-like N-terminal domain-containing protein n=1 Tax=Ahniella affigens TaxID=2021234 RepID=A0A2P1PYH3_9GAMM|nr:glycosyltransferase [Ahniella affigens]AVP99874.1 hypothetical protein C7S18_23035 [Ahniella affigens]